jgi:type VII secretion-associated serine protease mycosin
MLKPGWRRAVVAVGVTAGLMCASAAGGFATGGGSARAASSDSIRESQSWVLSMLDAYSAWQQTEGAGVTVAVLDSGVYPDISDLSGNVINGANLTGVSTPFTNPDWGVHGTWMASLIAGHGHDGGVDGIMGIAPQAKILSIRVIPEKNDPNYHIYEAERGQRIQQSLATGIRDAVNDGAQVISMSLGYTAPSATVRAAVQYAFDHGVVLVASSGNSGQDDVRSDQGFAPVSFPAEYPGVLSVAALKPDGSVADFSSNNLSVQAAAPGFEVPAQGRDGQYWLVSGTSPACALVAGVAALIKSKYRGLAPDLVLRAITSTARNGPAGGYNVRTGFGSVDAAAALRAAGILAAVRPARSPVATSARFGGGPAATPAAPVRPRGTGSLVLFALLALVSLAVTGTAGVRLATLRRARLASGAFGDSGNRGAHAVYFGPPAPLPGQPPPAGQALPPGQVPPPGQAPLPGQAPAPGYVPPPGPYFRQSAYPQPGGYGDGSGGDAGEQR